MATTQTRASKASKAKASKPSKASKANGAIKAASKANGAAPRVEWRDIGRGMKAAIIGEQLHLVADISAAAIEAAPPSKTGRTKIVANIEGWQQFFTATGAEIGVSPINITKRI